MKERLRSIRYGLGDVRHAIAAPWKKLSIHWRRRIAALVVVVAAVVLIVVVAVPALPCSFPGGDQCAPDDDAIALVPEDALAYVHANLDADTQEYEDFADLAEQLPLFSNQIATRALAALAGAHGDSVDFDRDIRPWFGGEVALAMLGDGVGEPDPVELIEVADADGADEFAEQVSAGTTVAKQINGFLVVGSAVDVDAIADTAKDGGSLAGNPDATDVLDELPEHHVADAWISREGISRLVVPPRSPLTALTPLLAPGASEGAGVALGAGDDDSFELAVRSKLDPKRAEGSPGFFAAFPAFEPELPDRLPAGTLAYLGFAAPGKTVKALLEQAASEAPGVADAFDHLRHQLRHQSGLNVIGDLVDSLGDEAGLTLNATSTAGSSSSAGQPFPYLTFVSAGVDEDKLHEALAALQGPLGDITSDQQIAGIDAHTLQVSPAVAVTYAIVDGLAVAATSPDGVAAIAGNEGEGLDEDDRFDAATDDFPEEVSLLGYIDFHDLVALGEQLGLAEDPVYATFAGEFRRLDALAFAVDGSDSLLATDARLRIGAAPPADAPSTPVPAPSGD